MTPEQKQRIEQIRERQKTRLRHGTVPYLEMMDDIDDLLSLVKEQEGDDYIRGAYESICGPVRDAAATAMRSACVEKVAETHDSVESACNAALMDVYDLSIANAPMPAKDCREIADCIGDRVGQIRKAIAALTEELESLSIEKPKE